MNKIERIFDNKKALLTFITGGDPNLSVMEEIIVEMEKNGADLIEIGVPFSDPVAEGALVQEANIRSLSSGTTTDKLFDSLQKVRERVTVPFVLFTYANTIFKYGKEAFMKRCAECGVEGVEIPDVPYEEMDEFLDVCRKYDVCMLSMFSASFPNRIPKIVEAAQGYLFCASTMEDEAAKNKIKAAIQIAKEVRDMPCVQAKGVVTPHDAKEALKFADGIHVEKRLVELIAEHGAEAPAYVGAYVKSIKEAVM